MASTSASASTAPTAAVPTATTTATTTTTPASAFRISEGQHDQDFAAAGVLIFWRQKVLLCRELRRRWNEPNKPKVLMWSTFGGKRNRAPLPNETARQTMLRELQEESGLTSEQIDAMLVIEEQYWNPAGRYVLYLARIDNDEDVEALDQTLTAKLPALMPENPSPLTEIECIQWHSVAQFFKLQAHVDGSETLPLFGLLASIPQLAVERVVQPMHRDILVVDYIACWKRIQLLTRDGEEGWRTVVGPANAFITAGSHFAADQVDIYPGSVVIRGEPRQLDPEAPPPQQFLRGYAALCMAPDGKVLLVEHRVQYPRLAFMIAYMLRDFSLRGPTRALCRDLSPEEILRHAFMLGHDDQHLALAAHSEIHNHYYLNSIGNAHLFNDLWNRACSFLPGDGTRYKREVLSNYWQDLPVFGQLRLAIRRAFGGPPGPSHWNLPKGAKERQETDGLQAALRELKEETGIDADPSRCAAAPIRLQCLQPNFGGRLLALDVYVLSVTDSMVAGAFARAKELAEVEWKPLPAALDLLATHYLRSDVDRLGAVCAQMQE